jgi:hypothetical protein
MSDVGARPPWRDALVLAVLAAVLIGGLVHYGRDLAEDDNPSAAGTDSPSAKTSPTAEATAQLEGAPPSDPTVPQPPGAGTCWDGREIAKIKLCGLPDGARGLAWVFPSFDEGRPRCHESRPKDDSYPVVESYECVERALRQPVTITYEQVKDAAQVERWLVSRLGMRHMHRIPGAHGGRWIFKDSASRPTRITGLYVEFPYVVSVFARNPRAAERAWRVLVRQRPPEMIRGTKNS